MNGLKLQNESKLTVVHFIPVTCSRRTSRHARQNSADHKSGKTRAAGLLLAKPNHDSIQTYEKWHVFVRKALLGIASKAIDYLTHSQKSRFQGFISFSPSFLNSHSTLQSVLNFTFLLFFVLSVPKFKAIRFQCRLDFQPFCAPAFLRAHHGWITGLPYCIFDQSEICLHESCRQVSHWSIQSCQQQRWPLSLWKNFLLPIKSVSELFKIGKFGKYIKKH